MKTHDITVTLNAEEHEFLMDIITMTEDMFHLASSGQSTKYAMLRNIKKQLETAWVDRFPSVDGISTPSMGSGSWATGTATTPL
jgi:hypothetical protein